MTAYESLPGHCADDECTSSKSRNDSERHRFLAMPKCGENERENRSRIFRAGYLFDLLHYLYIPSDVSCMQAQQRIILENESSNIISHPTLLPEVHKRFQLRKWKKVNPTTNTIDFLQMCVAGYILVYLDKQAHFTQKPINNLTLLSQLHRLHRLRKTCFSKAI